MIARDCTCTAGIKKQEADEFIGFLFWLYARHGQ